MIQTMTREWKAAAADQRQPRWFIFTDASIQRICGQVKMANPNWHMDLYADDLSKYLHEMSPRKLWWLGDGSLGNGAFLNVAMLTMYI